MSRPSLFTAIFARLERGGASDRLLLKVLFFAIVGVLLVLAITTSTKYATEVPVRGGTLTEGIVGIPRFVNPALAITRADQDMVALVYSGLLRLGPDNTLVPDLAESMSLSEDGRTYTFALRKNAVFHDGTPLTAEDVAYTIALIQNPDLKSPLRGNWNDVSVAVLSEYDLTITLEEAYAPFIENFTLGVMPKHIWHDLPIEQLPFSQYNTEPIGSGPFSVEKVARDRGGLIGSYELASFEDALNTPNLARLEMRFYQNESLLLEALRNREISTTAYLPTETLSDIDTSAYQIVSEPLPRIFGVFFNQNRSPILRDKAVREALALSIDREALIDEVLLGYGIPTTLPIVSPKAVLESAEASLDTTAASSTSVSSAQEVLRRGGWTQNSLGLWEKRIDGATETLTVTVRTSNSEVFSATVAHIADRWRALGVEVQVEQYEQSGLVQSVIRPRDFEALLFGIDMSRTQDLYPFWHSSQKDDPGLNVAQYTNINVDRLLQTARTTQDEPQRLQILHEAANLIAAEYPAVFLFTPSMTYVIDADITTTPLPTIQKPSDRFVTINDWYADTDNLWPIFWNNEPSTIN